MLRAALGIAQSSHVMFKGVAVDATEALCQVLRNIDATNECMSLSEAGTSTRTESSSQVSVQSRRPHISHLDHILHAIWARLMGRVSPGTFVDNEDGLISFQVVGIWPSWRQCCHSSAKAFHHVMLGLCQYGAAMSLQGVPSQGCMEAVSIKASTVNSIELQQV